LPTPAESPDELVAAEPAFVAEPEYVAAPELVAEPEYVAAPELPAEPELVAEPASPAEPIDPEPLIQQPLFVPAVSADRWAATARPPEPDAPRKPADLPASWQPLGAIWPAPKSPEVPWQGPDPSSLPAAVVAAQQVARPTGPAIWADSSQEVMSRGNVRACHHCALPVSTHARFCRRCGTQQV
jgi:ribosomal protein L40E